MNKYFRNFILCGDINHHCLLCKESFQTVDELEKHIRWEKHRKSIKDLKCMPKFKNDSIYKIDDNFYCIFCNFVMPTIAEISVHIGEVKHKENKANPKTEAQGTICRRESGLIVIGKIKVTNKEWNGVVDSKCIFCDTIVENFVEHISMSSHMIQMIKSEICTNEQGQYYRKINKDKSYCFMCKKTFAVQSATDHWNDNHHDKNKPMTKNDDTKDTVRSDQDRNLDVAVKLINLQKDYFDIDLENRVAMCKICTAYVNINFKFMIEHRKTHSITNIDKTEHGPVDMDKVIETLKSRKAEENFEDYVLHIFDHGKKRSELAKFGKNNYIKLVPPGGKGYCSLCNTCMSAHMNCFTEHIRGQIHMGHLELKGLDKSAKPHCKPSYKTKPLKDYLKTAILAKEFKIVWINKQHFVDTFCFMLTAMIDENAEKKIVKCYACDVTYDLENEQKHYQTEKHQQVFLNSQVITTISDEFVREIHPNLYHCGICNLTYPFWETLEKHLRSWKHVFAKNDNQMIYKLLEQFYGGFAPPSLHHDNIYQHLKTLGILHQDSSKEQ